MLARGQRSRLTDYRLRRAGWRGFPKSERRVESPKGLYGVETLTEGLAPLAIRTLLKNFPSLVYVCLKRRRRGTKVSAHEGSVNDGAALSVPGFGRRSRDAYELWLQMGNSIHPKG